MGIMEKDEEGIVLLQKVSGLEMAGVREKRFQDLPIPRIAHYEESFLGVGHSKIFASQKHGQHW